MDLVKLGSQTAKNGFKNEKDIAEKFNQWKKDYGCLLWAMQSIILAMVRLWAQ